MLISQRSNFPEIFLTEVFDMGWKNMMMLTVLGAIGTAAEMASAQSLCVAVSGGFGNGGTTFIGHGFSVPAKGVCKSWAGVVKTASTVVGTTTGAGCTSSDGKVLTLTLNSTAPSFFGAGNPVSDHIQLCPGNANNCPVAQLDQGSFFSGPAAIIPCNANLLKIPSIHD